MNSIILPIREAIISRNEKYIQELAYKQVTAGAEILDVNTAMGLENEEEDMVSNNMHELEDGCCYIGSS